MSNIINWERREYLVNKAGFPNVAQALECSICHAMIVADETDETVAAVAHHRWHEAPNTPDDPKGVSYDRR
jgi:hypothetical protein